MKLFFNLIGILTLVLSSLGATAQEEKREITLEDIYSNRVFSEHSVEGVRSMNDGEHFTTLEEERKIVKYSYKTGEVAEIVFNTLGSDFSIEDYTFSANETKILLAVNAEYIYRRSYRAEYYIYDIVTQKLNKLSTKGKQKYAHFSPNALKVAFVRDNNMFITDLEANSE